MNLTFYDLKKRKKFSTDKFKVIKKLNRHYAIAKNPSGTESWLIISKDNYKKLKGK